jgi:hypothetical protein
LKFNSICQIKAFSNTFNLTYLSKKDAFGALEDLEVIKPTLSLDTLAKLNIHNWDSVGEYKEPDAEVSISSVNLFNDLLNVDIKDLEDVLIYDEEKDIIDYLLSSNLISTMKTTQRIQQHRRLFNTIVRLKYELICHNILSDMRINRTTISSISNLVSGDNKKYVLYSVLFYYNRLQNASGYISPTDVNLKLNEDFLTYFGLKQSEINFD